MENERRNDEVIDSIKPMKSQVVETIPNRHELRTENPWEAICGHTRAVRCGSTVIIAGTTASNIDGGVLHVIPLFIYETNKKKRENLISFIFSLKVLIINRW
jgi:hypothetical protein